MFNEKQKYSESEKEIKLKNEQFFGESILKELNLKLDTFKTNFENNKELSMTDSYEKTINKLMNEVIAAQNEIIKEKEELEKEKNEIDLDNEIEIIQGNINELNKKYEEEIKKNFEHMESKEKELEILTNKNKENEDKIKILEKENENLVNTIKQNNYDIQTYNKEISKLKEQVQTTKEQLNKEREENKENKEKIKKLEEDNKTLQKKSEFEKSEKEKEINNCLNLIQNIIDDTKLNPDIERLQKTLEEKEKEIKICLSKSMQQREEFYKVLDQIKEEYKDRFQKESKKLGESLTKKFEESFDLMKKDYVRQYEEERKIYDMKFNQLNDIIKNRKENTTNNINIPKYSYECINKNDLVFNFEENTDVTRNIELKNNGNIIWDKDSYLKIVDDLNSTVCEIKIDPRKPEETIECPINFNFLQKYQNGKHKVYLEFYSAGKNYGEKLEIKIKQKIDILIEFIVRFDLLEVKYTIAELWQFLKINNFDFENAFGTMKN